MSDRSDVREDGSEVVHYDDLEFPVFCRYNHIPAGFPLAKYTPHHWHDEVELIFIEKGMIHHTVNGDYLTLNQGQGLFINSRQFHELITDPQEDCTLYCLIFNPRLLRSCIRMEQHVGAIADNENLEYIVLNRDEKWKREIIDCLVEVVELDKKANHESEMIGLLHKLWNSLYLNVEKLNDKTEYVNLGQRMVKEMIRFIQANYKEDISLEDICIAGGSGKTKCTELFKKYVHLTPVEYLRGLRLEKSVMYLRDTDMTVSEIAYEVGFAGASYYGEYFKKMYGITPLQFRRKYQEYLEEGKNNEQVSVCYQNTDN